MALSWLPVNQWHTSRTNISVVSVRTDPDSFASFLHRFEDDSIPLSTRFGLMCELGYIITPAAPISAGLERRAEPIVCALGK